MGNRETKTNKETAKEGKTQGSNGMKRAKKRQSQTSLTTKQVEID